MLIFNNTEIILEACCVYTHISECMIFKNITGHSNLNVNYSTLYMIFYMYLYYIHSSHFQYFLTMILGDWFISCLSPSAVHGLLKPYIDPNFNNQWTVETLTPSSWSRLAPSTQKLHSLKNNEGEFGGEEKKG